MKLSDGASVLPHGGGDGVQYSKVDVPDGFPFGRVVQNETYVSTCIRLFITQLEDFVMSYSGS